MSAGRPPGAKSQSPGYDRPEVMPEDPAVAAAMAFERKFVREKRGAGVSWQNIARMLNTPEGDLRTRWGGVYP